ncbi:MAG: hypothetical protein ACKPKO_41510, partial [Candidatus Fonsibacter sp.]
NRKNNVAETVAKPIAVAKPTKKTGKVVNKRPIPVTKEPPMQETVFEVRVAQIMEATRDARKLRKRERIQGLIAQATSCCLPCLGYLDGKECQSHRDTGT